MSLIERASELAAQTPEDRNRYVDFLRVLAITAVVVGHWMVIDIRLADGPPTGQSVLAVAPWTHWATWLFQVIPIFFLVGGYANASSWRSHQQRGGDWGSWLYRRSLRLLWPTTIFVVAGVLLTPLAAALEMPVSILEQASWAVAIILWFLAVYLGIAVITPVSLRAHDRWGLGFVVVVVSVVAVVEMLRFAGGVVAVAYVNYALVWGVIHQLGFAWRDGRLTTGTRPLFIGLVSAAFLVGLVVWGPYPVSMVTVPGAEVQNTGPPTAALLALGFAQSGFLLALRHRVLPLLQDSWLWTAIVAVNLVIMSVFLWHVVPVILLATILWTAGVALPGPAGSMSWLAFRPVWALLLVLLLIPVVLLLTRVERPPERLESLSSARERSRLATTLGLAGIAGTSGGLARLTLEGFWAGGAALVPIWGVAAYLAGISLIIWCGWLARRPRPR